MKDQPQQQQEEQLSQVEKNVESQVEDIDGIPYLCGNPFCDVILAKSHVSPNYNIQLPVKFTRQLPRENIPAYLRYNRQNWEVPYQGKNSCPRFGYQWRNFVDDNNLAVGDACVFELLERSDTHIRLKVHILRGELPPELQAIIDSHGTLDNPIVIE